MGVEGGRRTASAGAQARALPAAERNSAPPTGCRRERLKRGPEAPPILLRGVVRPRSDTGPLAMWRIATPPTRLTARRRHVKRSAGRGRGPEVAEARTGGSDSDAGRCATATSRATERATYRDRIDADLEKLGRV